jgi:cell division transport system ATP-binding protein
LKNASNPFGDILTVKDVNKTYPPKLIAVSHVSFSAKKGEFLFIIGRSGAGKTTLFRLLSKQEEPDSGSIILDEQELTEIPKKKGYLIRRKLGVVYQDFKLIQNKTVWENVAFALEVQGKPDRLIRARVPEVLETVGLNTKHKSFPHLLSGGEQQRVAIARAIVNQPIILFADEPTGNLDWETSSQIMQIFQNIHKQGTTIIMATHNEDIVQKGQYRTLVIHKGKKSDEIHY